MSLKRFPQLAPTIFISALVASCANPKRVDEQPIALMRNGDRVESPTRTVDAAMTQALESRIAGRERLDAVTAAAFATCAPTVCAFTKTDGKVLVLVLANLRNAAARFALPANVRGAAWRNALDGQPVDTAGPLALQPYQYLILKK